jgi:hypothetical protein
MKEWAIEHQAWFLLACVTQISIISEILSLVSGLT